VAPSDDLNATGLEFLTTEVNTALTFTEIALGAGDDVDKVERNRLNARKAYDTVLRFRDRVAMSKTQSEALDSQMERLRNDLLKLGEAV
jgi:hypothetical protein